MQSSKLVCPHCHKDTSFQPETVSKAKWLELKSLLRSPQTSTPTSTSAFLSGVETDLRRCQQEIDRHKIYISALETKQKLLQRHHDAAKALTAPIRKFPPEILTQIFSYACEWNVIGNGFIFIPGLAIGQVCSYWRNVVLPKTAWTGICWEAEHYDGSGVYSYESMIRALAFLFKKAENLALDVELGELDAVDDGWVAVMAESDRWRSLSLDMNGRALFWAPDWLGDVGGKLPRLEELKILASKTEEGDHVLDFGFLGNIPQISVVSVEHSVFTSLTAFPGSDLPPWTQQLRVLRLTNTIFADYMLNAYHPFAPLFSCTSITEAQISCNLSQGLEIAALGQRNVVATLQSLELNEISTISDMMALLSSLSLPKLTSLSLEGGYKWESSQDPDSPSFSIEPFLSQSQCNIATLSVRDLVLERLGDHRFVAGEELVSDTFFNQMNEMPPLLPNIEHLTIKVPYTAIYSTPDLFLHTIQSRWMPDNLCDDVACLRFLSLALPAIAMETETIQALERLYRAGMTIAVKDKTRYVVG
ncbi:hypothetical protein C8J56DRAFT_78856 [Mycena floridula]|nr:hypothetical protein C8J56DRAFT_78856 [Mycena floridula]